MISDSSVSVGVFFRFDLGGLSGNYISHPVYVIPPALLCSVLSLVTFTTYKLKVVPVQSNQRIVYVFRREFYLVVNDFTLTIQSFAQALFTQSATILEISIPCVAPLLRIIEPPTKILCHTRLKPFSISPIFRFLGVSIDCQAPLLLLRLCLRSALFLSSPQLRVTPSLNGHPMQVLGFFIRSIVTFFRRWTAFHRPPGRRSQLKKRPRFF